MLGRILRPIAALLLIAGLVHILAILRVPAYTPHHVYDAMTAALPAGRLSLLDPGKLPIGGLDPAFVHAVCPITRESGPVRLGGAMPADYWSVALVNDRGRVEASTTREDADTGAIDVIAGDLGDDSPPPQALAFPLDDNAGFLLIRVMPAHAGAVHAVEERLKALACAPYGARN